MSEKRKIDRTGEDWEDADQTEGLAKRIKFTAPEKEIILRPGTEQVVANPERGLRWSKLIDFLVEAGIVARTDQERTVVKKAEGLEDIPKIIQDSIDDRMENLDLREEDQRREFIELWIREEFKMLHAEIHPKTHERILGLIPTIATELATLIKIPVGIISSNHPAISSDIDCYMTVDMKVTKKMLTFIEKVNDPDMSSRDYQKVVNFFSKLRGIGVKIANHKYNCSPEQEENLARNFF